MPTIKLYTRRNCPICEPVKTALGNLPDRGADCSSAENS